MKPMVMVLFFLALLAGCGGSSSSPSATAGASMNLLSKTMVNEGAYIPSMCWTKTEDETGKLHNPCYTCHTEPGEPNYTDDSELQQRLSFPASHRKNPWANLFTSRADNVAAIRDDTILGYVRQDNYRNVQGEILPSGILKRVPKGWDFNGNGIWDGYVPDCHFTFDDEGFDRDTDGDVTGWRAFAYYPFPGTFWPTNGSADDVLIRLGDAFRKNAAGELDLEAYKVNLAVVEALIKREDVAIPPVDEAKYGVDLDKNGALGTASRIKYDWAPLQGREMAFVGMARQHQQAGTVHLAAGLFPEGTEFLHSVRYIDVTDGGGIRLAARMKELRYAKKLAWRTYSELQAVAHEAEKEKHDFPDRLEEFFGDVERGVSNGQGWVYQGFIEDAGGDLRPQTYEETVYCMGCHGGLGVTTDGTFAFRRKLDADACRGGWHHWSQKDLAGVKEPKVNVEGAGTQYEYSFYLMYNKAGDELRGNDEVLARFFNADNTVKADMLKRLHDDVTVLIHPSRDRALMLDKAYKVIVEEQSFRYGRDPVVVPAQNVEKETADGQLTKVATPVVAQESLAGFNPGRSVPYGGTQAPPPDAILKAAVEGAGMAGPDGTAYAVSEDGLLHKSSYTLGIEGFFFPFPDRLTLPTRTIVPNGGTAWCYTCHRLPYPVPPENLAGTTMAGLPVPDGDVTEGGKATRLTDSAGADVNGKWNPGGTKIAWASGSSGLFHIRVMNADGTGKIQITTGAGTQGWPEWSADGTRIVYWDHDAAAGRYAIRTVKADGTDPVTVVESPDVLDMPAWRPDGQYIAYAVLQSGNWDVWAARSDGSASYRLTTSADMESNPLWSPDGTKLAFKVAPSTGQYTLTEEYFLTFENGISSPTTHAWSGPESIQMSGWSPDGTKIAYTAEAVSGASGADRVSYVAVVSDVALAGSIASASNDTILSGGMTLGDRGPVFSPDGKKIAFWGWDTSYKATVWLYDLETSSITQRTRSGFDSYPRWSPDGRKILFESNRSGNLDLWVITIP